MVDKILIWMKFSQVINSPDKFKLMILLESETTAKAK